VPRKHIDESGHRLGERVYWQRRRYRERKLSEERASRLAALPGWAWDARARSVQAEALPLDHSARDGRSDAANDSPKDFKRVAVASTQARQRG
jgi:hypothetical protein